MLCFATANGRILPFCHQLAGRGHNVAELLHSASRNSSALGTGGAPVNLDFLL
ncbi:hypothetical protein C8R48DRAFT_681064, partial [Suillus tomentosus]